MSVSNSSQPLPAASRVRRAAAFVMDVVLILAAYFVAVQIASRLFGECTSPRGMGCALAALMVTAVALCLTIVPLIIAQMVFIARRGYSIGMYFAGLRVVRSDGSPAGFVRGVVLRSLPMVAALLLSFAVVEVAWLLAMALVDKQTLLEHWNIHEQLKGLKFESATALAVLLLMADAGGCLRADGRSLRDWGAGTTIRSSDRPE